MTRSTPTSRARVLDDASVRRLRVRAQRLDAAARARPATVADVVGAVTAVQAQDLSAGAISIGVRASTVTRADVDRALDDERSIVRTWSLRGTLHIVRADDLPWLLEVVSPSALAGARARLAKLGLGPDAAPRATAALLRALERHGPQTRRQVADHLRRAGVDVDADPQVVVHVLWLAAMAGDICWGPGRGRSATYVLTADWLPRRRRREPAMSAAELARRHLRAYGPATVEDLTTWSGLRTSSARDAWRALAGELTEVRTAATTLWMLKGQSRGHRPQRQPALRLLPAWDTYRLGYRDRRLLIDERHQRLVWPGGGQISPSVAIDGWTVGHWRLTGSGRRGTVEVASFHGDATDMRRSDVAAEVAHLARFLSRDLRVTVVDALVPPLTPMLAASRGGLPDGASSRGRGRR